MSFWLLLHINVFLLSLSSSTKTSRTSLECDICKEVIEKADEFVAENTTMTDIEELATYLCEMIHAGGQCQAPKDSWQCEQVCKLAVQTYSTITEDLILHYLDPSVICYTIDNNTLNCPQPIEPDPTPIPNIISDDASDTPYNTSDQYGYILHIPDLHWDMEYSANTVANCGEPVCCRSYDNNHSYSYDVLYGGIYGINNESINCDAPRALVESLVEFIESGIILNNSEGINGDTLDFIVFVGDIEAHDVYNQTKESHLNVMENWIHLLYSALDKYDIPIFFDLGNHEGLPVNNFGGPSIDDWFNGDIAKWLKQWIDTGYSMKYDERKPSDIMAFSGYYTSLIRPRFRLISLNTGYIDSDNFYLTITEYKYIDIAAQYKWLNDTLYRAKYVLNETVVIIQHHPIKSAIDEFEKMYYDLYTKYNDIIMSIFAGHTHVDQFHVLGNKQFTLNSKSGNVPYATWFSPGSITQYGGRNPALRVYQYNRNSYDLVNYYQYRFDTEKSNVDKKPYWFLAYDAVTEYGIKDISAQSMTDMAYSLATNDTLWNRFQYNFANGVQRSVKLDRNGTVCDLLTATKEQYNDCVKNVFKSSISAKQYQELYWS